jgi:hypothetical protein
VVEQRSFKPLALGSNPNVLNWFLDLALLPEVSPSGKAFDFESNRRRFDSVYLRTIKYCIKKKFLLVDKLESERQGA